MHEKAKIQNKRTLDDAQVADQHHQTKTAEFEMPSKDMHTAFCDRCETKHDWRHQEHMECIPPLSVLLFGKYQIDPAHSMALYEVCKSFNTEEVVGSFLGHNPHFLSQETWLEDQNADSSEQDGAGEQDDDPSEQDDVSSEQDGASEQDEDDSSDDSQEGSASHAQ